jgi:hypothetical protein
MRLPVIRGTIERRMLVNFRIDPAALAAVLPSPMVPKLVGGYGLGGICLIRLGGIRPVFLPKAVGVTSENAAHRLAVQWGDDRSGVFIPRRDTSSWLNSIAGGRLFPGVHHRSVFDVVETDDSFSVCVRGAAGAPILEVRARLAADVPSSSVFRTLAEASDFFQTGAVGFSPGRDPDLLDGIELRTKTWNIEPLAVEHVSSHYFEDTNRFPAGSTVFDSAFLMRNVEHEWHSLQPLYCGQARRAA